MISLRKGTQNPWRRNHMDVLCLKGMRHVSRARKRNSFKE